MKKYAIVAGVALVISNLVSGFLLHTKNTQLNETRIQLQAKNTQLHEAEFQMHDLCKEVNRLGDKIQKMNNLK